MHFNPLLFSKGFSNPLLNQWSGLSCMSGKCAVRLDSHLGAGSRQDGGKGHVGKAGSCVKEVNRNSEGSWKKIRTLKIN